MIRFRELRPNFLPSWIGMSSENAAHRIAVEWDEDGQMQEGVFIPRRDTNSWFNKTLGGRVFPGIFNRSTFDVSENGAEIHIRIVRSDDGEEVAFSGCAATELPSTSLFPTLDDAAGFFSLGATGYSATREKGHYHGMELNCLTWKIQPLDVIDARSCFFGDATLFPSGSVEIDCALLMQDVDHEWRSRPDLYLSRDRLCLTKRSTAANN